MAQEGPQSILRSLEEVSSDQRCVCLFKPGEVRPSYPVLTALPSPLSVTSFSLRLAGPLCLLGIDGNGKSPSKSELRHLYLTEKYVWRWKQFLSRRGKRTPPLDLKLGHNNWLRQVSDPLLGPLSTALAPGAKHCVSAPPHVSALLLPPSRWEADGGCWCSPQCGKLVKTGFFCAFLIKLVGLPLSLATYQN